MKPSDESDLEQSLGAALRESEQLDFVTTSRLRAARRRALEAADAGASHRWQFAAGGLGALALAVALAFNLPLFKANPTQAEPAATIASAGSSDALEVLADDLDPEFYEDLELYQWLASDPASADPAVTPSA